MDSHDVVLTVPHGHADEDRAAEPVARALYKRLAKPDEGLDVALILNRRTRKAADGNRPESRSTKFRRAIAEELGRGPPRLLVDVHSFRPKSRRFSGRDIVLLHTPGLSSLSFLKHYAKLLRRAGRELGYDTKIEVGRAKFTDDVCIQARELGVARDSLMLAEHNDLDHPLVAGEVYGAMHYLAIKSLLDERNGEGT